MIATRANESVVASDGFGFSPVLRQLTDFGCNVYGDPLAGLCQRVDLLPGADERVFIDIDSLLRPVYGQPNKAPPMGTPRSPGNRSCAKAYPRW